MNKTMIPVFVIGTLFGALGLLASQLILSTGDDDAINQAVGSRNTEQTNSQTSNPVNQEGQSEDDSIQIDAPNQPKPASERVLAQEGSDTTPKTAPSSDDLDKVEPEKADETMDKRESNLAKAKTALKSLAPKELEEIAEVLEELLEQERPEVEISVHVSGTVEDAFGNPVEGAKIYALATENGEMESGGITINLGGLDGMLNKQVATSNAAGEWFATVKEKISEGAKLSISLEAMSEGFANSKKVKVVAGAGEEKSGVKLLLRGAGVVSGWVRDAGGVGVEGIKVGLNPVENGGGTEIDIAEMLGLSSSKYTATTDASGFYRIEGVPEGSYKFKLKASGIKEASGPKAIDVLAGKDNKPTIDFVVERTLSLIIKLIDSSGEPVRSFGEVSLIDENGKVVLKKSMAILNGRSGIG